jgi:hypothetical protein
MHNTVGASHHRHQRDVKLEALSEQGLYNNGAHGTERRYEISKVSM